MFDAARFCDDHGYRWEPASDPWIAVECPWCGNASSKGGDKLYGGINTDSEVYNCWRCGPRKLSSYLWQLLGPKSKDLIWEYSGASTYVDNRHKVKEVTLPGEALLPIHRNYLAKRGFDPDFLVEKYGIQGTGPYVTYKVNAPDPINLSNRLIIPIFDTIGRLVTWQSRDVTNKARIRYIGCPDLDSLMSYKQLLYGSHTAQSSAVGVVEGLFDQWRMGDGWVTCFGTGITPEQIKALSAWERVAVVFDGEALAQKQARALAAQLEGLGCLASSVDLEIGERDCADLSVEEVRLVRDVLKI